MEYKIQEFQTGLDVASQLFGNQDNIAQLMIDNDEFDINKMQQNLTLIYSKQDNKIVNEISNNNYTFINRENVVYNLLETIIVDKGYKSFDSYSAYYGRMYAVDTANNNYLFINSIDDEIVIYEDGTSISIFIEEYNEYR